MLTILDRVSRSNTGSFFLFHCTVRIVSSKHELTLPGTPSPGVGLYVTGLEGTHRFDECPQRVSGIFFGIDIVR